MMGYDVHINTEFNLCTILSYGSSHNHKPEERAMINLKLNQIPQAPGLKTTLDIYTKQPYLILT